MPNTLTFTAAIPVPNVTRARVSAARFDESAQVGVVDVLLIGPGGIIYSTPGNSDTWTLNFSNGTCDALVAAGSPLKMNDCVRMSTVTNATAFTQLLAAYRTSRDSFLTTLATLGMLPAGTVA